MGSNPSHFKAAPGHPVEMVSWDNAVAFCSRLSALAEEKAAGRRTACRRKQNGNTRAELEARCGIRLGMTRQIWRATGGLWATQPRRPTRRARSNRISGAFMMSSAMCGSGAWIGTGRTTIRSHRHMILQVPSTGSLRVNRGGGWDNPAVFCWAANRGGAASAMRDIFTGFRVAVVPAGR